MKIFAGLLMFTALLSFASVALAKPLLQVRLTEEKAGWEKPLPLQARSSGLLLPLVAEAESSPLNCYNSTGNLNVHDSAILCAGAASNAPVDCYNHTGQMNAHDSAILCSGAHSNAPIDCYNATGNLDAHNSAILCSGAVSNAPIDCYNGTGNINAADSAILCSHSGSRFAN